MRFLTHSAVTETLTMFIIAFVTYFVSEACEFSGIITLLTCGITMAHYTWYNLSPQGKTISSITVSIFGSAAESIVFAYIGLCVCTYAYNSPGSAKDHVWSVSFIGWITAIIIVGRVMAVSLANAVFKICAKGKPDYTTKELIFIMYGGMIRGAIAFGLVLKIPTDEEAIQNGDAIFRERGVVVTTTLAAVIITTVGFGSFMPVIQKVLVPPTDSDKMEYDDDDDIDGLDFRASETSELTFESPNFGKPQEKRFYSQAPGLEEQLTDSVINSEV